MRRSVRVLWLAPLAPTAIVVAGPVPAHAAIYLSLEEAGAAIFPGQTLAAAPLRLSEAQRAAIATASGMQVRRPEVERWTAPGGATLYRGRVLGKHEEIVFALGIAADGTVAGVEILEYRETYGGEIRRAEWRAQFRGRKAGEPLALGSEIDNISGATLSCRHITDGVRRLLATHAALVASTGAAHAGP